MEIPMEVCMGHMCPMEISTGYMYHMEISAGYMYPMEISNGHMHPSPWSTCIPRKSPWDTCIPWSSTSDAKIKKFAIVGVTPLGSHSQPLVLKPNSWTSSATFGQVTRGGVGLGSRALTED